MKRLKPSFQLLPTNVLDSVARAIVREGFHTRSKSTEIVDAIKKLPSVESLYFTNGKFVGRFKRVGQSGNGTKVAEFELSKFPEESEY